MSDLEQVMEDIAKELGCAPDNEEILAAIAVLKKRRIMYNPDQKALSDRIEILQRAVDEVLNDEEGSWDLLVWKVKRALVPVKAL